MKSLNAPDPHIGSWRPPARRDGSPSLAAVAALVLGAAALAVLLGMVATTNSPILIGLLVGSFFGVGLLGFPTLMLWVVLIGTLVVGGLIAQFLPALNKANWLFSMLGFLLFASAVISAALRRKTAAPLPWWARLALAFPVYAVFVAVVNQTAVFEFLAGFKRYFQFWGVFACLALVALKPATLKAILNFVVAIALVQIAFVAYQRAVIVPKRVGLPGVVPIDAVSGTFESSFLGGGASSVLVLFLLIVFAFVLRLWLDKGLSGARAALFSVLLLAPLALGETKIVVVFLPLVFFAVLALDLKSRPFRTVALMSLGLALTVALGVLYLIISAKTGESMRTVFENIVSYNFGSAGYHTANNLNRSTVLSFWWTQQHAGDPVGLLLGNGPGSSYSGEGALVPGKLAIRYAGLAIAFTTLSGLLWDFGLIGFTAFLLFNLGACWSTARIALRMGPGARRSVAVAVFVGLAMNMLLLFMGNSATALPSHSTIFLLLLGAAVLLHRDAAAAVPASRSTPR